MSDSIATPELVAIGKLFKEPAIKAASAALPAGEHEIDLTVRLTGKLVKGDDYTRLDTVSVPLIAALALAVRYAGATGDAAQKAICRAVREAAEMDKDSRAILEAKDGVADAVKDLKKTMAAELPLKAMNGMVKAHLNAEVV